MIRFLTAGESHGRCLTLIVEGVPAGLRLSAQDIDVDLKRRQMGYGRGGRMKIESDKAEITSGVRSGVTLGSPIAVTIQNRDWENWQKIMSPEEVAEQDAELRKVTRPRPGHADLAGGIKYGHKDLRQDYANAVYMLAFMRENGYGCVKDLHAAFELYKRGANLNEADSQCKLALLLLDAHLQRNADVSYKRAV